MPHSATAAAASNQSNFASGGILPPSNKRATIAAREPTPRKVLFGPDGPWLHPGIELHKIRLLGLRPAHEALILGGNLVRLLRQSRPKMHEASRAMTPAAKKDSDVYSNEDRLPHGAQPEYHI